MLPDGLANFISNNYGNNYHVADLDGASNSAGSIDGLGLEDVDEIDTKNMTIYSGVGDKRERRPVRQQQLKKEPVEVETINDQSQMSNTTTSSLLLPSNLGAQEIDPIDADLMLNTLGDQPTGSGNSLSGLDQGSDNGLGSQSIAQNQLFDETSQVSSRVANSRSSVTTFVHFHSHRKIFSLTTFSVLMAKKLKRTKSSRSTTRSTRTS